MKYKVHLNNVKKSISYRKENTTRLYYRYQLLMFKEIIVVYSENHTELMNTQCE
jgi:hypothetical protein